MEVIYSLLTLIFKITLFGAGVLIFIKLFEFRRNQILKNNIQVQEAKIKMLRVALKTRVRKKVSSFRKQFKKPFISGDHIDEALQSLANNSFEKGDDFQNYFDDCRKMNIYIATEQEITLDELLMNYGSEKFDDFMGPDMKNEIDIIRAIKLMTEATSKHYSYVETFNRFNPKNKQKALDPFLFLSLYEVKRIFRDQIEKAGPLSNDLDIETQIENIA